MAKNKDPQLPRAAADAPEESATLIDPAASVRNHLLVMLGRPKDLFRINVVRLWQNTYRANVLVGKSITEARCAHSYFLTTTDCGKILTSVPNLANVYS